MGHKVNPIGMRLQVNRTWDSRWYADTKDYGDLLLEDIKIREFIFKECKQAGISRVIIERPHKKCRVTVHTARPGVIIAPLSPPRIMAANVSIRSPPRICMASRWHPLQFSTNSGATSFAKLTVSLPVACLIIGVGSAAGMSAGAAAGLADRAILRFGS